MHPAVEAYIRRFENEAKERGLYRKHIGPAETLFLEKVLGPALHYRFDGLTAEYPFKDARGGHRYVDFTYQRGGTRLAIEIDGFTTHARDLSPGDFDDHLVRQNALMNEGWLVYRFSVRMIEREPEYCRSVIERGIGRWWIATQPESANLWDIRKRELLKLAMRHDGEIRAADVAAAFPVDRRTAQNWLRRFAQQGVFEPVGNRQRVSVYRLKDTEHHVTH